MGTIPAMELLETGVVEGVGRGVEGGVGVGSVVVLVVLVIIKVGFKAPLFSCPVVDTPPSPPSADVVISCVRDVTGASVITLMVVFSWALTISTGAHIKSTLQATASDKRKLGRREAMTAAGSGRAPMLPGHGSVYLPATSCS